MRPIACTTAMLIVALGAASPSRADMRIAPCAASEYTAAIGGAPAVAAPSAPAGPAQLTLVLAGDTGFNPKGAPVDPKGFTKNRQSLTYAESLSGIADDIVGELAFLNLETVITDRNDLEPDMKGQTSPYNFRSHPAGLNALVGAGFNLFSLANNHSMDYGPTGAEETLYHIAIANASRGKDKTIAYAGLGADFEEATRPGCLDIDG
ncbi:MAG: CapA family protein, partial [Methyloceanibacter sp.]|nr:CapA family protein [Methyloceanibacter sp.]